MGTIKLFGTDGIRARAGEFPLDRGSVCALGEALAGVLRVSGLPAKVLVGRDTRESGVWMEEIFISGIETGRGEAVSAGVIPTSAVSLLTRQHGFSAGVVLSASHNPYQDNGIKIFSAAGTKISEDWENELEAAILRPRGAGPAGAAVVRPNGAFTDDYAGYLKGRFAAKARFPRYRIVLDCANGAASAIAPLVFRDLGCDVLTIHDAPDGRNINLECGSLYPGSLVRGVREFGADIGVAYDGDADRAVFVDETGRLLSGDHTLFIQARFMKDQGRLKGGTVVATTMSNMGLEEALRRMNLTLLRTRVGDKYVLEEMMKAGANLGGEASGHTIFLDDCPTGDGILTSLKMVDAMADQRKSLSAMAAGYVEFPQVLVNVKVSAKPDFRDFPEILAALDEIKTRLGDSGRVDLRYSGTEPLARIMVEGRDENEVSRLAGRMAKVIAKCLGA